MREVFARQVAATYAGWVDRNRYLIVVGSVIVAAALAAATARLSVRADMSYLLPQDATSVRQLRAIEKRARVLGTVMVAVQSDNPGARGLAARLLYDRLSALVPDALSSVTFDDRAARQFAWEHRWLYVSVADLRIVRDAVQAELREARLRANPLYVDLDDGPSPPRSETRRLRERLHEAENAKDAPAELVSKDGRTQLLILRTAYAPGDIDRDRELLARVGSALDEVRATVRGVEIGAAGDVVLTVAEHEAIVDGMVLAAIATIGLVLVGLLLFYRSVFLVAGLSWALVVGVLATFAFAEVAVGHLNLATAFLSSIVIGNGINFGIVLVARYQEAVRAGEHGVACIATTIRSTLAGTLAAALAAAIAYGSLMLTSFRGFRDFGIIAGVGILPCWIAAYTVLPAVLAIAERSRRLSVRSEPMVGRCLAWLAPPHAGTRVAVLAVVMAGTGTLTWRYLSQDPFERDFRNLRSHSTAIDAESQWMERVDAAFGQGISGGFVIAVADRAEVAPLVAKLRAHDAGLSEHDKLFARIESLDDLVPADQAERLALLAELRGLLSDPAIDELESADRDEARALRPPVGIRPLHDEDIPDELAWPYIEADGTRGKLVLAMPGWGYDNWNAADIVRFARDVRGLELGRNVLLGGSSFVFADMLALVNHDGPRATLAAIAGAVLLVLALVGRGRHGLTTLACGVAGVLGMLALAAAFGLRVNFLDFVSLPITIGIGIDYAANLAARDRHEGDIEAGRLLAHTGSAVLLCSFTTIVGYGSLLLSRNQGIRSFGTASILGEATCLGAALLFAPALLSVFRTKTRTPSTTATGR